MPYEILPHTADIRVRAHGASLEELFRDMMRGMFRAAKVETKQGAQSSKQALYVTAPDRDALLVDFLNEVLYLGDIHSEMYDDIWSMKCTDTEINGEVSGHSRESVGLQIKAATYFGLKIEEKNGRFEAAVIFDI